MGMSIPLINGIQKHAPQQRSTKNLNPHHLLPVYRSITFQGPNGSYIIPKPEVLPGIMEVGSPLLFTILGKNPEVKRQRQDVLGTPDTSAGRARGFCTAT